MSSRNEVNVDPLDRAVLDELQAFSAPSLSNGIETFDVRPRHEGFADPTVRCMFPELGPRIGYAATATIRAAAEGDRISPSDLWEHVLAIPEPRIVVVQDLDDPPGVGSYWGEVNGSIFTALGCVAVVTNGAVRDLTEMRAIGLQAFAGCVAVSHAYNHLVSVGEPVNVGGLEVRPGDLLHGDQHGVLAIPKEIAGELAAATRLVEEQERGIIEFCRSPEFSVAGLLARARQPRH
jgi:4-hydroxy-4-methyl-2-oxoglutarate aldolase